jgi:O-antigen ligase
MINGARAFQKFGWADALIALSIGAPILIPLGGEITILVLTLLGGFLAIQAIRSTPADAHRNFIWSRADTLLALCMASMFALQLLSVLWAEWPRQAASSALKHLHFLVWPLVMLALSQSRQTVAVSSWSLVITLLVCAAWMLLSGQTLGWKHERFEAAAQNASVFGRIVAFYGLWALLLASTLQKSDRVGHPPRGLLLLATFAALLLVLSTGNRIETVAYLLMAFIFITWRMLQWRGWKMVWGMGLGLLLLTAAVAYSIGDRVENAAQEARSYFSDSEPKEQDLQTSIGIRLEIYYMASRAIAEKPILGWGAGSRPQNFRRLSHHPDKVQPHTHLHSQYLQTLTDVGFVGALIVLGFVLTTVFVTVIRAWKKKHHEIAALFAALIGIQLLCGVFNPAFSQGLSNSVFVMMMALLWVMLRQQENAPTANKP